MIQTKYLTALVEYFKTLLTEIKKLNDELEAKYHIVDCNESTHRLKIQVAGKNQYFYSTVNEIIRDKMIAGFSKTDLILINRLIQRKESLNNKKVTRYRFAGLICSVLGKRTQIKLVNQEGGFEYRYCAEALTDDSLLETATDRQKVEVGYMAGYEKYKEKNKD